MKSRGIEVEIEPSSHSRSTEKMLLKRVVVPHRILMFWPHWRTMRGVAYYPPKVIVYGRRLLCRYVSLGM
jgi:hypothetical protein